MARPQLLFLCQTLPFPPDSGVHIRTYNILRLLARNFDVTALCFYRWKGGAMGQDVEKSIEALRELADVEAFPIPQEHHRLRLVWDHVRSVASRRAYTVFTYDSAPFRARLEELLQRRSFDLAHLDSLDLSGYIPLLGDMPVVCVHHDAQSVLLNRRAGAQRSWLKRAYLHHQSALTKREEEVWCEKVDLNVTVSSADRDVLQRHAPAARFEVVPNGVDTDHFRPEQGRDEGCVFVGGTTWFPNQDALIYFSEQILPELRAATGGTTPRIDWVGRASEAEMREYRERFEISLTGYVPDVRPYVRDAACYVVPLRVGGGTRIKILDAWAMGKAVVSTSIGCEGLAAVDGENILIRDTPQEFASAVAGVLQDETLRSRLGQSGRETVETVYSWEVIGIKMLQTYGKLAHDPSSVRPSGSEPLPRRQTTP